MGRGWLGLGQHHSRDKASVYADWGDLLSPFPVLALARPCYTNLTNPSHSFFSPSPFLFFLSPSPSYAFPFLSMIWSTQEEETSHSCAYSFFILTRFGWGAEQGSL